MISVVLSAFALVSVSSAFPFIPPQDITPDIEGVPQVYSGVPLSVNPEPVKNIEVQSPSEVHSPIKQVGNPVKTAAEVSSQVYANQPHYNQENPVVPKVQSAPVNVEHVQPSYTESPVLLPIQPLSVVNQGEHVWRPVIVPAEAIADGRVIVAPAQGIQQRSFSIVPEPHIPHLQTIVVEPYQQADFTQSVEKQTPVQPEVQPTFQENTLAQVELKESVVNPQTVPVTQEVQKSVEASQNQGPVEQNPQVYSFVSDVQSAVAQGAEPQVHTYSAGYTPDKIHSNVQKQLVVVEKQTDQQGNANYEVQNQDYQVQTPADETVKQQVLYQRPAVLQTENVNSGNRQNQIVETQVPHQVSKCSQVQNQPVEQVYNPESVVATKTGFQEQYQQDPAPVQVAGPQHNVQTVDTLAVQQELVQKQTVESGYEQFQSAQPENHYQVQTAEHSPTTSEVKQNQQDFNVQVSEDTNYSQETVHRFGDKISQAPIYSVPALQPVKSVQK